MVREEQSIRQVPARRRGRRRNRLTTDAVREIRFTFSRFLSILVLSALAVAFLAGLRTTAPDMEYTADNYYDRTHMMDGYVISTLGLAQEDLDALAQETGIQEVEGGMSLDATARDAIVSVRSLPETLNLLEVTEGRLPQAADECVTESLLMVELGLEVGDTLELTLDEDNADSLTRTTYTVVGVVNSPLYVGSDRGSSSLGGGTVDAFLYVSGENFNLDYYTEAYFTLDGLAALDSYSQEYEDRLEDYLDGLDGLADQRAQLRYDTLVADAQAEIADGEAQLADARQALADLDGCEWYVLGRTTNSGFAGYSQDAERVGNLANVFPVIFFLVAALACLTTMTRMVEDQRTEIGALKAMGFSRLSISKKYIGYAFWASLLGGLVGLAVGCTLVPAVIANAFQIMYNVPSLEFKLQPAVCVIAVLAAVACTTGAALWACLSTLIDTPANLMRPKAPKAGKRVFLEYIKPVWKRLSFTWKVTMRNLFRYQRRFWMTVIGIGGCTALIVTGFGLHDSIFAILDKQFDEISLYDATASLTDEGSQAPEEVLAYLDQSPAVDRALLCYQSAADVSASGAAYSAYLLAVDDPAQLEQFIHLRHRQSSDPVEITDGGVVITEKLAELLEVSVGDTVTLDNGDDRVEAAVTDIVENYVYHYVYLTDGCYEALFGQPPEDNTVLVAYADGIGQAQSDQVSADLMAMDQVASYSYIATIRDSFTDSMNAINYAVVIIILAAAALAFVVLYNLTNINITERTRELATLKVLGFYDRETTAYVYRENVFLTLFGIVLGLVLGRFLHAWMVVTVEVDLVMFGRTAPLYAYLLAAALTVVFSVVVNIAAHFRLKKVDMVESLKTVE